MNKESNAHALATTKEKNAQEIKKAELRLKKWEQDLKEENEKFNRWLKQWSNWMDYNDKTHKWNEDKIKLYYYQLEQEWKRQENS